MPLQWLRGRFTYTPLQTDDAAFSGSSAWRGRPFPTIFTLRQLKLAAFTIFGLLLLLGVGVYNRDQIEAIRAAYSTSQHDESPDIKSVDWSRFAYVQYVTNKDYLCNSVMFFERLQHLESKADRVLMYPSVMLSDPLEKEHEGSSDDAKLLILAREKYNVKLDPISVQHRTGSDPTWADSFTKLLAFNQTKYDRVLSIDSDSTLLQHMDELFSLPSTPVAMPRAYWLHPDKHILSSQVILIQPSQVEFTRIKSKINNAGRDDYDMELVNELYQDSAMVLPHRPYDLLTGEFSGDNHQRYLGSDEEAWDPVAVYNEAKLLHFSDWPLPKPWLDAPENLVREREPKCVAMMDGLGSCAARDIWRGIYEEFRERRKVSLLEYLKWFTNSAANMETASLRRKAPGNAREWSQTPPVIEKAVTLIRSGLLSSFFLPFSLNKLALTYEINSRKVRDPGCDTETFKRLKVQKSS